MQWIYLFTCGFKLVVHCDYACAWCLWLMVSSGTTLVQNTNGWLGYQAWYEKLTMIGSGTMSVH